MSEQKLVATFKPRHREYRRNMAPPPVVKKFSPSGDWPPYILPHNDRIKCAICDVVLHSEKMMDEHIHSTKHKANIELEREHFGKSPNMMPVPPWQLPAHIRPSKGQYICVICVEGGLRLNSTIMMEDHVGGRRHGVSLYALDKSKHPKPSGYVGIVKLAVDQNIAYNKPQKVMGEEQDVTLQEPELRVAITGDEKDASIRKRQPLKQKLPRMIIPFGTKYRCQICSNLVLDNLRMVEQHAEGKRHFRSSILHALRAHRDRLVKDKHGVEVKSESEELQKKERLKSELEEQQKKKGVRCESEEERKKKEVKCEFKEEQKKKEVKYESEEERKKKGVTELTINIQDQKPEPLKEQFTIENKGRNDVYIHNVAFLRDRPFYKLKKPEGFAAPCPLAPGKVLSLNVIAQPNKVGRYHTILILGLKRKGVHEDIFIIREIQTRVVDTVVLESDPTTPYQKPIRISILPQMEVVDGEMPKTHRRDQLEKELELKNYPIPKITRAAVNCGMPQSLKYKDENVKAEVERIRMLINDKKPSSKRIEEYHSRMSALLHIEELQMEVDIRMYDLKNIEMTRDGKLLELKVPGLAENRPSVLRGDQIFVRIIKGNEQPEDLEYKGYVHQVKLESVLLGFNNKLLAKFINKMKFNVRFTFNRLPLKLQHRATELARNHYMEKLLFPQPETICTWGIVRNPTDVIKNFYDRSIEANKEQATAVQHILAGSSRPAPYLIFGPPGTGKTVTVVESIKQVLKHFPESHVLACAPSNSAADLITQRVAKHVPKSKIFRMYAGCRKWSDVPEDIRDISNYDREEKEYFYPSKVDICKKSVVVVTMVTAGRLASANFPPNHFTHIFIDEAGHAFESEAMIAVAGILESHKLICKDGGQLVLAGDPKQLGPIVRSPYAKDFGLEISLLERLMTTSEPFKRHPFELENSYYDSRVLTKLVDNYRSHPVILDTPNKLFYDGELRVCADKIAREAFCQWEELPTKNFPIIFHGVIGKEVREGHSPSWFNPEEVAEVHKYVGKLMTARGVQKLQQTDIGIIAPYRQQVVKIKLALRKRNYDKIKIGSVEEFQGQEKKVIIISTVRSCPEYLAEDDQFKLGFLANPKKFNVATTRAKALMIVIGNPNLLQHDPAECWNKFLDYCLDNGGYKGVTFVPLEKDLEQIEKRATEIKLGDFFENPTGKKPDPMALSEVQSELHPGWRGEDQV